MMVGWGGEVKFYNYNLLQMIQDELAKKEMEKPVNLRNVERSLLKRAVDDVMRLLVFLTPKISVKSEAYNPEAYITLDLGNCEEDLPKKPVVRLSVNCWPCVDQQSANCWPTVGRQTANRFCPKYRLPVGRQSAKTGVFFRTNQPTCKCKCLCPFIMFYNKFKWLNSLSPYLGKIISLLLIGQLKNPSMVPNK